MKRTELKSSAAEKEAWETQRKIDGYQSLSGWVRDTLNEACQDKPAKTLPGWGDHNRTYKCLWCGHTQKGSIECEQCGEEEFTVVERSTPDRR